MSNSGFRIDGKNLLDGLIAFDSKKDIAINVYANTVAKDFETYAKKNRPWTDRTGEARRRLTGCVEKIPIGYRIYLAHGVDYGMWLETAREKKYAILEPTIRLKSNEALKGLSNLLERITI